MLFYNLFVYTMIKAEEPIGSRRIVVLLCSHYISSDNACGATADDWMKRLAFPFYKKFLKNLQKFLMLIPFNTMKKTVGFQQ